MNNANLRKTKCSTPTKYALIAPAALLTCVLAAGQARADSSGTTIVPAFKIGAGSGVSVDIPVPAGYLRHVIKGRDRHIEKQWAAYHASLGIGAIKGQVCNWQIDFSYKDGSNGGKEYLRERGKTIHECSGLVKPIVGFAKPKSVRYGQACAELWVNGKFRAAECRSIVKPGWPN